MTAEDPVEYNLYGINQVLVRTEIGMTFAAALKAFLRQDPNIIMVGEIRDLETGGIAIKAALTGHLVLSTLHTNSAPRRSRACWTWDSSRSTWLGAQSRAGAATGAPDLRQVQGSKFPDAAELEAAKFTPDDDAPGPALHREALQKA
jgi:hypothetical protein